MYYSVLGSREDFIRDNILCTDSGVGIQRQETLYPFGPVVKDNVSSSMTNGSTGENIIGPFFIDGNLNGETYLALLQNNIPNRLPQLAQGITKEIKKK
ncbi:hypothetical protein NQ318_015265 [Aromia moschata]|uniref:Uncharacterized protein n=1 Tax=Aromia moschata TaxID=1265417 RepID=A0AAV8YJ39_9CUCU|nr:hypothetical protein NQ318_015265 [Aromia moschata]